MEPELSTGKGGDRLAASYDEIPYPPLTHPDCHPDRLATIAHLAGLDVPDPAESRVLEVGCGTGVNTAAMASTLPGSTFLGIDISPRQVAAARKLARDVRLQNVRFEERDIRDVGADDGLFDYIVAHGIYSWVPSDVREHLLRICRENLAPNGIAYVSYNTYPGGHALQAMREMLAYHARDATNASDRVRLGLELARTLAESVRPGEQLLSQVIHDYAERLDFRERSSGGRLIPSLAHDDLAEFNDPVYFHQFVADAEKAGLQWFAEARGPRLGPRRYTGEAAAQLGLDQRTILDAEQYLDFIEARTFRRSLLTHAGKEASPEAATLPARLARLHVATDAEEESEFADPATGAVRFRTEGDEAGQLTTNHPVVVAALRKLVSQCPAAVAFKDLADASSTPGRGKAHPSADDAQTDRRVLAEALVRGFCGVRGLVHLHVAPPAVANHVTSRPAGYPLARVLASRGERMLPNVRGDRVNVDPVAAFLLPLLDGSQTSAQIAATLTRQARSGELSIEDAGGHDMTTAVVAAIPDSLRSLARRGLLVG